MAGLMDGKVALVTGAGSGIGRASAAAFAREGAKVVVSDVNAEGGEETVRRIREAGGEAVFVKADVSKADEVEALVAKVVERYGRIDAAHNNAGIAGVRAPMIECTEETWDRTIAVNLKGAWLCMRDEIRQMLKQGAGAIVNTSSASALTGTRGASAYTAATSGVLGLTRSAALECAEAHIRVNAVCPGVIDTPMIRQLTRSDPKVEAQFTARIPLGRMGTPQEVAEAVVWLCSDSASFVTGQALLADGGMVMR